MADESYASQPLAVTLKKKRGDGMVDADVVDGGRNEDSGAELGSDRLEDIQQG